MWVDVWVVLFGKELRVSLARVTGVRRRLDLQWAQTASAKVWYEGSGTCV